MLDVDRHNDPAVVATPPLVDRSRAINVAPQHGPRAVEPVFHDFSSSLGNVSNQRLTLNTRLDPASAFAVAALPAVAFAVATCQTHRADHPGTATAVTYPGCTACWATSRHLVPLKSQCDVALR